LRYSDFEVIRKVGEGNFTEIYQVEHGGKMYAMKVCQMAKVKNLRKETDILMEKHALNKLYDAYKEAGLPCVKLVGTFKDTENLYFLMELLPQTKELWHFCRNFGLLSDFDCRRTFRAICEAVSKVHALNIVHRDLKPENMFKCEDNTVKLIDFGSA